MSILNRINRFVKQQRKLMNAQSFKRNSCLNQPLFKRPQKPKRVYRPAYAITKGMTNWQNSQWLQYGADPKRLAEFSTLVRP
jgi:hypothetical protein